LTPTQRFSHKDPKSHPKKLSARVRFPGALDMAPYTTHARAAGAGPGPPGLYAYELFAVVCHEGALDTGHYYAFARAQDAVRPCAPAVRHALMRTPCATVVQVRRRQVRRPARPGPPWRGVDASPG
jgi:hypothetical protein